MTALRHGQAAGQAAESRLALAQRTLLRTRRSDSARAVGCHGLADTRPPFSLYFTAPRLGHGRDPKDQVVSPGLDRLRRPLLTSNAPADSLSSHPPAEPFNLFANVVAVFSGDSMYDVSPFSWSGPATLAMTRANISSMCTVRRQASGGSATADAAAQGRLCRLRGNNLVSFQSCCTYRQRSPRS